MAICLALTSAQMDQHQELVTVNRKAVNVNKERNVASSPVLVVQVQQQQLGQLQLVLLLQLRHHQQLRPRIEELPVEPSVHPVQQAVNVAVNLAPSTGGAMANALRLIHFKCSLLM